MVLLLTQFIPRKGTETRKVAEAGEEIENDTIHTP